LITYRFSEFIGILIMENQKSISKSAVATISALSVSAIVVGGGLAWMTLQNNHPIATAPSTTDYPNPVAVNPAPVSPATVDPMPIAPNPAGVTPVTPSQLPTVTTQPKIPTIAQNQENTVKIWRLDDNGKKTFLVPQDRQEPGASTANPEQRVQKSMSNLIASAGKPDGKLTTTVPVGTKLLSSRVMADGIHVDLSKEFNQVSGATSVIGRLGQVIYTATAQNPDAPVWITIEGKKLELLGDGAGIEVRQPITRQTYNQDFPINPAKSPTP
jgi:spore germination protein GerM